MYLSKLELHGFKSFADQTVLEFAPGTTAIVGPNGCGKSNIVDAVRWVIGEQRARVLRSDTMSDVIFNGTANRKPLGMAEVQLTIENTRGVLPTEYAEVQLGRRVYRSGDSEYLMNNVQSRLKDIQDLFMDTGMGAGAYSVIELKMVEEILSGGVEDRRHLFEEAAGITKYKLRRRQALRKLDNTQADLTRLRDLTDEVEKTVRRLKRQAKKTRQHRELAGRLHELELALAQSEFVRLRERQRALQQELETLQEQVQERTTQLDVAEAELEARRKEQVDREKALAEHQQVLDAHLEQVRELETNRRLEQERLEAARRELERVEQEQEQAAKRRDELDATVERLTDELAVAEPALEQAEQALREAEAERDRTREAAREQQERLRPLRRDERQAEDDLADHRRSLDRLANRIELLERDRERLAEEESHLDETADELAARERHARGQVEEAEAAVEEARGELEQAERLRAEREDELTQASETLRRVERSLDAARTEVELLESLVASYEEFPDAVRFLADQQDWQEGEALRTVADLIGCDEADRLALDAALGDLASCIVVEREDEVSRALAHLRSQEKGRATFLVLERLRTIDLTPAPAPDGAAPLRERVRVADNAFAALADVLLHDAFVTGELEAARAAVASADYGRFFARSGEWVDARGLEHGGSERQAASPVAGRFGRREQLDAARDELERLETAHAEAAADVDAARESLAAVEHETARHAVDEAEQVLRQAQQALERVSYEQEQHARHRVDLTNRAEEVDASLDEDRAEVAREEEAAEAARQALSNRQAARQQAETALEEAELASREAADRYNEVRLEAVQTRNQRDNLQRSLERARADRTELEERREQRAARLNELRERIAQAEETLAQQAERLQEVHLDRSGLDERVNDARTALTDTRSAINEIEHGLRDVRRAREEVMREENERQVRLAQVQTRTEDLLETIAEDYERDLAAEPVELPDGFDADAAQSEVQSLRSRIKKLGSVNPLALEEYEEEQERLDFLTTQRTDLEEAEDTLLDTITEINTTASERFEETFDAIRTSFRKIFRRLFGEGAEADLVLEEPDDLLDTPIEIMAKPRGKRPAVLTQLSSGEKTLTAIALLFSIYLVKPSPFCILDEVDAPLDDMNVTRFMQLISEFSNHTQFIMVTHNKLTMEAADRLYGVTMQEQGVSRLVGVHFDEAVELVG